MSFENSHRTARQNYYRHFPTLEDQELPSQNEATGQVGTQQARGCQASGISRISLARRKEPTHLNKDNSILRLRVDYKRALVWSSNRQTLFESPKSAGTGGDRLRPTR